MWLKKCLQNSRGTPGDGGGNTGVGASVFPGQAGFFAPDIPEEKKRFINVNKKKQSRKTTNKNK